MSMALTLNLIKVNLVHLHGSTFSNPNTPKGYVSSTSPVHNFAGNKNSHILLSYSNQNILILGVKIWSDSVSYFYPNVLLLLSLSRLLSEISNHKVITEYYNMSHILRTTRYYKIIFAKMISPRIELGTFCVLSRCHNQLDHETRNLREL